MKILTLLILLSLAFTAGAQTVKKDTAYNKKPYKVGCRCYLPKDPEQLNPYPFADSVKAKKPAGKAKKENKAAYPKVSLVLASRIKAPRVFKICWRSSALSDCKSLICFITS
jgi:hypothetical protein